MNADRIDFRNLEDSPSWPDIARELEHASVAQVAHRRGLAASAIRAAMRRTGVGRAVRVFRPEPAQVEKSPVERMPRPQRRGTQTKPSSPEPTPQPRPMPKARAKPAAKPAARPAAKPAAKPVARPAAKPRRAAAQGQNTPSPGKPVAVPPVRPGSLPDVIGPGWAWRVHADQCAPTFVIAPTPAAAAALCAERGLSVRSIERYAPVLGA